MNETQTPHASEYRVHASSGWIALSVLVAFACGVIVATMINGGARNTAGAVFVIAAVLVLGYGLAHLFVTNVIVAGRIKRRRSALVADDVDAADDDWVDEVVHPDS